MGQRQQALRAQHHWRIDHLPVQRDDALVGIFRPGKDFNDSAGMRNFVLGR